MGPFPGGGALAALLHSPPQKGSSLRSLPVKGAWMTGDASAGRRPIDVAATAAGRLARAGSNAVTTAHRRRVRTPVTLQHPSALAISTAYLSTVEASARLLRPAAVISNTPLALH